MTDMENLTPKDIITTEEFNKLIQELVNDLQNYFRQNKIKEYPLTAMVFSTPKECINRTRDSKSYIISVSHHEERFNGMKALGKKLWEEKFEVAAVFVCFESWAKEFNIGQAISSRPLSEYQDKMELFCLMGETIDYKINAAFLKINKLPYSQRIILHSPKIFPYKEQEESGFHSDLLQNFYKGYLHEIVKNIQRTKRSLN